MTSRPSNRLSDAQKSDWAGILFGLGIALLAAFQQFKLPPVLPEMLDQYRYGSELAGMFMSIFAIVGLLSSFKIGQAMQRQSIFLWLFAAFGLIFMGAIPILSIPGNGWAVLSGRGLEGIAMAILAVAGPSLMTRNAAPRHLPIAAALAALWVPLGGLLATIIARIGTVFVVESDVWMLVWVFGLGFALLMVGWTVFLVREGGPERIAITRNKAAPDSSDPFSNKEDERSAHAKDQRALLLVALCFGFWSLQNLAVLSWLPEYLVADRGIEKPQAKELYGLTILLIAVFNVLGAVFLLWISVGILLSLALAGQVVTLLLGPFASSGWDGLGILIAYGMFTGVTPTCLYGLPARISGPKGTGPAAFGLLMTGRNFGVLIGPVLVGWISSKAGWAPGWWVAAGSALCATLTALFIYRLLKRRQSIMSSHKML